MKKLLFLLIGVLFINSCVFAKSGIFKNFPDGENVSRVHIGKAMLKMAGKMDATEGLNDAVKDMKSIDIYTVDDAKNNMPLIRKQLNELLVQHHAEEVVVQEGKSEANEIYLFYSHPTDRDADPIGMLIVNISDKEANLVYIEGTINVDAFMNE